MSPEQIAALASVIVVLTAAGRDVLPDVRKPWIVVFTLVVGPLLAGAGWATGWFPDATWRDAVTGGWAAALNANGAYAGLKALMTRERTDG